MTRLGALTRLTIAAAAVLALSGCVVYPTGGYYGEPGYYAAAPTVIVAPRGHYGGYGGYGGHWRGRWR
jgi:predicted N-acetyltransferase YhbS